MREPRARDGVVWHRDPSRTDDETDKLLTVWLGLNPANPQTGGLRFVRGGHRGVLEVGMVKVVSGKRTADSVMALKKVPIQWVS